MIAWLQTLGTIEVAMFVMVIWISATFGVVALQYAGRARGGIVSSTLVFGSFAMTAISMVLIMLAGLIAK